MCQDVIFKLYGIKEKNRLIFTYEPISEKGFEFEEKLINDIGYDNKEYIPFILFNLPYEMYNEKREGNKLEVTINICIEELEADNYNQYNLLLLKFGL